LAYQALYNKYRPQTFDEVVGQKPIVQTLKNALKEGKIGHAYLFCGPRGTGKTTMARLFAKALDCKEGVGHQCNACDSCRLITTGDHPDVIEIDAASNSTVDSVRQLIDNVSYQPVMSPYKVYIIDEVHNMSNSAFNALLKTLEEPPSFVVFILATTEPQKILPTILSRVQRFDFSKVSKENLVQNMARILKKEGIAFEEKALDTLASLSDGGVRDSLSLLDQLVSYSGEKITNEDVNQLFGLLSTDEELSLLRNIEQRKTDEVLTDVRSRYQKGADLLHLHDDLIALEKDLLVYQTTKDKSLLQRLSVEQAESFPTAPRDHLAYLESLMESRRGYRNADSVLSQFELSLLDLTVGGGTQPNVLSMPARKEGAERRGPAASPKSAPVETPAPAEKRFASRPVEVASSAPKADVFQGKEKKDEPITYTIPDLVNLMRKATAPEQVAERKNLTKNWAKLKEQFDSPEGFYAKPLFDCRLHLLGEKDILLLSGVVPLDIETLMKKSAQPHLRKVMETAFGKPYHVLTIPRKDFTEAFERFRTGDIPQAEPHFDFGEEEKKTTSTDFFNELTQD